MNCSTVWKIVKKFKENGNTIDRKGQGRKQSICTPQLIKNMRKKLQRNPCRSCRLLAAAAGVSKSSMHRVLRNNLGRKLFKILHCHELTDCHVSMRIQKCKKILKDINEAKRKGTLSWLQVNTILD